jgi:hypothetical protein
MAGNDNNKGNRDNDRGDTIHDNAVGRMGTTMGGGGQ